MCSSVLHVFRVHSPFISVGLGWCDATVQNVGWSKRLPCEEVFSFDLVRDLLWHIRDNVGQESSQTEHDVLWLKTKHFTTRISPWIDRESSQGVQYYFNLFIISNGSILFPSQWGKARQRSYASLWFRARTLCAWFSDTRLLEFCKHQQKKAQHRESIPSPNTYQKSYHKEQFGGQDVPVCFRELVRVFVSDCRVSVKQIWPLTISTEPEEEIGKFRRFSAKTYVIYRPGSPYREKRCPRSRMYGPRAAAEASVHSRPRAKFFLDTDRPRPVNNILIFPLKFRFTTDTERRAR